MKARGPGELIAARASAGTRPSAHRSITSGLNKACRQISRDLAELSDSGVSVRRSPRQARESRRLTQDPVEEHPIRGAAARRCVQNEKVARAGTELRNCVCCACYELQPLQPPACNPPWRPTEAPPEMGVLQGAE